MVRHHTHLSTNIMMIVKLVTAKTKKIDLCDASVALCCHAADAADHSFWHVIGYCCIQEYTLSLHNTQANDARKLNNTQRQLRRPCDAYMRPEQHHTHLIARALIL